MNDPILVVDRPACRYAAYFAPTVGSAWWDAGSRWLGRCAATGQMLPQPSIAGVSRELQQRLTAAPRRYGWHATLKAPFTLAPGVDAATLKDGLATLCQAREPFDMPPLEVVLLDDFLALVPAASSPALDAVAGACVTGLHPFAAPLSPADLGRRRSAGLDAAEDALLVRWGYPFVLDRFRFHMSLTGSLCGVSPDVVATLEEAAQRCMDGLPPQRFDAISLFVEPAPGADFACLAQMALVR